MSPAIKTRLEAAWALAARLNMLEESSQIGALLNRDLHEMATAEVVERAYASARAVENVLGLLHGVESTHAIAQELATVLYTTMTILADESDRMLLSLLVS